MKPFFNFSSYKRWIVAVAVAALISAALLVPSSGDRRRLLCALTTTASSSASSAALTAAVLHYATSAVTPQQSRAEISVSYGVLRTRSPCNFLVFGLGHDSLMWHSFNLEGTTVFLEEDPKWVQSVLKDAPMLTAFTVRYRTRMSEADELLKGWRSDIGCSPENVVAEGLRGNRRCRLALGDLPPPVYGKEWDVIMIDAPKGYYNEAPGRMGAIYSAAVMARNRRGRGSTDVFLHDVDRRVEKMFAMEFLCKKNLVKGVGRLWHFKIPAVSGNETWGSFC